MHSSIASVTERKSELSGIISDWGDVNRGVANRVAEELLSINNFSYNWLYPYLVRELYIARSTVERVVRQILRRF